MKKQTTPPDCNIETITTVNGDVFLSAGDLIRFFGNRSSDLSGLASRLSDGREKESTLELYEIFLALTVAVNRILKDAENDPWEWRKQA